MLELLEVRLLPRIDQRAQACRVRRTSRATSKRLGDDFRLLRLAMGRHEPVMNDCCSVREWVTGKPIFATGSNRCLGVNL